MEITIETSEVLGNIDSAADVLKARLLQAVAQGCLVVEGEAKRNCPVDEGELRNSIQHEVKDVDGEIIGTIGTNKPYAPHVELGTGIFAANGNGRKTPWVYKGKDGNFRWTRGNRPQPFLYPALRNNQDRVKNQIAKHLSEGLK